MDQELIDKMKDKLVQSVSIDVELYRFKIMSQAENEEEREKIDRVIDDIKHNCTIVIENKLEELTSQ